MLRRGVPSFLIYCFYFLVMISVMIGMFNSSNADNSYAVSLAIAVFLIVSFVAFFPFLFSLIHLLSGAKVCLIPCILFDFTCLYALLSSLFEEAVTLVSLLDLALPLITLVFNLIALFSYRR